jgi:hypothetical protein
MIKPFPKPLVPQPKPKRLLRRKAVTIVAGFKCYEGIVLCADTQETVGDSKRNVPKLRFEPASITNCGVPDHELAVGFCGAGNNGVFMDEMVDRAWEDVQTATSLDEACDLAKGSIKRYHREAIQNYQTGYCPEVELIYGIKMHGSSRLFYSLGPAVTERNTYATAGKGLYLADFLASRMYVDHINLKQCVILAAYTLFQAKENVDGCGGESHIAILRNYGLSGRVDWHRVQAMTEFLKLADRELGDILYMAADLQSDGAFFKAGAISVLDTMDAMRESKKDDIARHAEMLSAFLGPRREEEDEYGFPKPSIPQTSEDQQ